MKIRAKEIDANAKSQPNEHVFGRDNYLWLINNCCTNIFKEL
jgi:hypothetical protein